MLIEYIKYFVFSEAGFELSRTNNKKFDLSMWTIILYFSQSLIYISRNLASISFTAQKYGANDIKSQM